MPEVSVKSARAGMHQPQPRDVGEVGRVEGPEGGVVDNRRGRDREIEFAAPRVTHEPIELGGEGRLGLAEHRGLGARKQRLLGPELLGPPRAAHIFT